MVLALTHDDVTQLMEGFVKCVHTAMLKCLQRQAATLPLF